MMGAINSETAAAEISVDLIMRQLERILTSSVFSQSRRLSRLLRYTVQQAIAGESGNFKEFLLGIEVFDKPASFDPRIDSIVRVEASRLRSRLKIYYDTVGSCDPVLIQFHKGSYVPVFTLRDAKRGDGDEIDPECATRRVKTIAVLPFTDLSATGDQGYIADGLTDELISELSKLNSLQVVAQTSVFQYKGRSVDIRQIGRELQADTVLEGSLRKAGPILRITAQIADVATGYIVWSGIYERLLEDVLAVQEEISHMIADALKARFG